VRRKILKLIPVMLAIISLLVFSVPAMAAVTDDIDITATPEYLAMTLSDGGTNTWAIGAIAEGATAWYTHDNAIPSAFPCEEVEMILVITNTGSIHENIKVKGFDFTGGAHGWVLSEDDSPGANEASIRIGFTGTANEAAFTQIIHEDTDGATPAQMHDLGETTGHIDACLELETGTFADGDAQTGKITFTCVKHT
jgi:hypothetical protein